MAPDGGPLGPVFGRFGLMATEGHAGTLTADANRFRQWNGRKGTR